MQKYIDKGSELQIRSVVALDHLKNYIYVEADKEAHVREVCTVDIYKIGKVFLNQAFGCAFVFFGLVFFVCNLLTLQLLFCFCFRQSKVSGIYIPRQLRLFQLEK